MKRLVSLWNGPAVRAALAAHSAIKLPICIQFPTSAANSVRGCPFLGSKVRIG
jgi:hypothetical protein